MMCSGLRRRISVNLFGALAAVVTLVLNAASLEGSVSLLLINVERGIKHLPRPESHASISAV